MRYVDVFNGDADGICALLQLQLSSPRESVFPEQPSATRFTSVVLS